MNGDYNPVTIFSNVYVQNGVCNGYAYIHTYKHTYIHTHTFTDPSSRQVRLNVEFVMKIRAKLILIYFTFH